MEADEIKKMAEHSARLSWACRRGMLELDVLLSNFLNEGYAALTADEKIQFVHLLNCQDPELYAWLLGREQPKTPAFAHLIARIRHHARSRI